jgi:hypothetical protein
MSDFEKREAIMKVIMEEIDQNNQRYEALWHISSTRAHAIAHACAEEMLKD